MKAPDAGGGGGGRPFWRPRLFVVVVPCFCFFLAMFVAVPLAVQVVVELSCLSLGAEDCNSSAVSSRASVINLSSSLALSIPSFLLSGLYGSIADKYGRKVCIVVPLLGYLLYTIVLVYIQLYQPRYFAELIIGCAAIMGCTGSFAVFQMAVFAYAADITTTCREQRGNVYSLLEACLFFAKIVGPLSAGLYAQSHGFLLPLVFSACLCTLGILWVIFVMPESLPLASELRARPLDCDPLRTMRNLYVITAQGGLSSPIPYLSLAFFLYFTCYMSAAGSLNVVYLKHQFSWGPSLIGYYDCAEGLVQLASMTVLPCLITKALGAYVDKWWLLIGYSARALHFLLFGLAPSTTFIFAIVPLLAFSGPLTPRTRAIFSNANSPAMQGTVLSAFSALQSLSTFCAPGFAAGFSVTVFTAPGAMYFLFSGLTGSSALILAWVIARNLLAAIEHGALHEPLSVQGDDESGSGVGTEAGRKKGEGNNDDDGTEAEATAAFVVSQGDGYDTMSTTNWQNSRVLSLDGGGSGESSLTRRLLSHDR